MEEAIFKYWTLAVSAAISAGSEIAALLAPKRNIEERQRKSVLFHKLHCRKEASLRSAIVKRSIVISGHKTSVSLEDQFWICLKEIAKSHDATLSALVADIESKRQFGNLSSAIRLFVLDYIRAQTSLADTQAGTDIMAPRAMKGGR